jgi:hypothetical protein
MLGRLTRIGVETVGFYAPVTSTRLGAERQLAGIPGRLPHRTQRAFDNEQRACLDLTSEGLIGVGRGKSLGDRTSRGTITEAMSRS